MKNRKIYVFFVVAVIIVLVLIIFSDKSVNTEQKDNILKVEIVKNNIEVKNGEEFVIELDSNLSTGYSWVSDFNKEYVVFVEKLNKGTPPSSIEGSEVVGVPIQEVFKFKALKTGETKINFYYLREWEIDVAPVDQKVFDITIK